MMYMGSKAKIWPKLAEVVLVGRRPEQVYVEPFCGGANSLCRVGGPRIANDSHPGLIAMWKALVDGWVPPACVSREEYYAIKNDPTAPLHLVTFVSFLCSFGGKEWGGYAANAKGTNYAERGRNGILKQVASLRGVQWLCGDYADLALPPHSLVYADPPYAASTSYSSKFSHDRFWNWVRASEEAGHVVYVSEYAAPDDFHCLLEVPFYTKMNKNKKDERIERLFRWKG